MKPLRMAKEPTYLRICWEVARDDGDGTVTLEASLCHPCRRETAERYPSARGCGEVGYSCDFCEGRKPRRVQAGGPETAPREVEARSGLP